MPFCQNCGARVESGDLFCGNCGAKILQSGRSEPSLDGSTITKGLKGLASRAREQTSAIRSEIDKRAQSMEILKSAEDALSSIRDGKQSDRVQQRPRSSIEAFKGVLTWVINTHVEALKRLTGEIAPHIISHNCLDGNLVKMDWGESCPATLENLLMHLPHVEIGLKHVADLAEVKKGVSLTIEELTRLKEIVEDVLEAYLSTREALKEMSDATNPIDNYLDDVGDISRKRDVTNLRKLTKYEKAMNKFMRNLNRVDWSKYPQMDSTPMVDVALSHALEVISMEVETGYHHVLYQYPYITPPAFSTDIERYVSPFFLFIGKIDEEYEKCRKLFEDCKRKSSLLRDPDEELMEEAYRALSSFNKQYHGIYSAHSYLFKTELMLRKHGNIVKDCERIMKRIDKTIEGKPSRVSIEGSSEIIEMVYKFVLLLNEVEPVLKSRAEVIW